MAQVPGVTVREVDVDDGKLLAVGQTDAWLNQELLLDRETYQFRGQISTVVEDATISPEKAGNATGRIEKGQRVTSARIAVGVVDEPGRRP